MAEALVLSGRITAADWAEALGGALARAEGAGAEDTEAAYYGAALEALEALTVATTVLTPDDLRRRKEAWADAYRATPHGQPVKLGVVD
ncbi:hypothetical protein ROA7023_00862 [Roseisalinus antarcticus]|uniref:Nitrile hydratase beta subunit n=2 Tax=Roseisalinus antarcticus TaxID=254357 RepID=A0A1Y5RWQ0_9RHOB|nr:hypothetical protein ROA7023_00862 [Roseisalinus antarcticus]